MISVCAGIFQKKKKNVPRMNIQTKHGCDAEDGGIVIFFFFCACVSYLDMNSDVKSNFTSIIVFIKNLTAITSFQTVVDFRKEKRNNEIRYAQKPYKKKNRTTA